MYDPDVTGREIERAVAAINATLTAKGLPANFSPEYHSVSEVDRNNGHFSDLLDPETGKLRRELLDDEKRWIRNERLLCQLDFYYWATRYSFILSWQGELERYNPNIAQRIMGAVDAEMERNGHAIIEAQLKARRLGVSTDRELKIAHRLQFWPNITAVVASSDPGKTSKMAQMIERAWRHQPWFLLPRMTGYQKGEQIDFGELDSHLILQWGNQQTGMGRGDTPQVSHLSEVAEFLDPEELIDAALIRAVLETRRTFLVLEGTPARRHDWWHRTWNWAKEHWQDGRSRLRPIFLPYFVGSDIYPPATWLRAHPVPRNWQLEDETIRHAERAARYVRTNALLRDHMAADWQMPREQMWWWEATRSEYKGNGKLEIFLRECCSDDLEAFAAAGASVFDAEVITYHRERAKPPLAVFGLEGPGGLIDPKFQPHKREIDQSAPRLKVDQHFTFVPLRFAGVATSGQENKIFLWEMPEDEQEYGLGVDPCRGVGADNAAIEVIRKGTMRRNDAQIAEFVSPHLGPIELAPFCYAIGRFFSTKFQGALRHAKMVIEIECGGNLTQKDLRLKYGWPVSRFHRWMRAYDQRVLDQSRSNQLGWSTNRWSREMLFSTLLDYLRNGWIDANSPWLIDEMADLSVDEETQKISAKRGAKDDRIMALGMVLFSLHHLETLTHEPTLAVRRAEMRSEENDPAPCYRAGMQANSALDVPQRMIWTPTSVGEDYEQEEMYRADG